MDTNITLSMYPLHNIGNQYQNGYVQNTPFDKLMGEKPSPMYSTYLGNFKSTKVKTHFIEKIN